MASDTAVDAENAAMIRDEGQASGFVIARVSEADPMRPKKPRSVAGPAAMLHPATLRGLLQMGEDTGPPRDGGDGVVLVGNDVSYSRIESGYPPPHSHDAYRDRIDEKRRPSAERWASEC